MGKVLDGVNLILSIEGKAMAFSTGCKISTSTETGERQTKETAQGKWPEKYAKKFSEEISADGLTIIDSTDELPSYDQLKRMQLAGEPVEASYAVREGETREGSKTSGYKGKYLITSLELDGQTTDDAKYSVKLESHGPVTPVGGGLNGEAAAAAASNQSVNN